MQAVAAIALSFALSSCAGCPPRPEPVPPPTEAPVTCESFCARAAALGCAVSRPTPKGGTCQDICEAVQYSGIAQWDLGCRIRATSCQAMEACELR